MTLTARQPTHHLHAPRWLTPALISLVVVIGLVLAAGAAIRLTGTEATTSAPTTVAPLVVTVPAGQTLAGQRLAFTGRGVDGGGLPSVQTLAIVPPAGATLATLRLAFTGREPVPPTPQQPSAAGQRAQFHSVAGW